MKKTLILLSVFISAITYANNDRYRLILNSDPATSITIGWDQTSGSSPVVYYGTTDHGTNHLLYSNTKTVDRSVTSRGMDNRFARLTGLTPNTNYYFLIRDSQGNSARYWFKTAPDDLSRLSFIAGGDSRNNRGPRQNANRAVAKLKPHAVFFGGDMTDDDTSAQWEDWFDDWQLTIASDGRMFPIVPAVGNHEGSSVIYELFDTPTSDSYYAMTFGDNLIRAYTLNTNISVSGNQLTWLENDLSNNLDAIWRTAQYHKPMRPHTSSKSEGEAHYQAWAELFYNNGVRLVIDCDSHLVKTTWPVQPSSGAGSDEGFIQNNTNGTVYAGEGCWGAPTRNADDDKTWTRDSGEFNQFKLIYVEATKIELRTVEVDNWNSIPENPNNDPFALPDSNSYLWNPSNGMVVTINHAALPTPPDISFADGEFNDYANGTNLTLDVDVINDGGGLTDIDFYIDGVYQSTDSSAPYSFTNTYASGSYLVEAIATNTNLQTDLAQININVGSYTGSGNLFISDGNDDVEEEVSTGDVSFTSTDLEMMYDGSSLYQKIGLRFQKLPIPLGATITSATIRFKSDGSDSNSATFNIYLEDSANAQPFEDNSSGNVSARVKVPGQVFWDVDNWSNNERGSDTTTPNLSGLLQNVVDKCDWTQGNSVVFIIEATGSSVTNSNNIRDADTYDEDPTEAAQLIYSYTYNAGVSNPDVTKFANNAWTNGVPDSDSTVIILDDYNSATDGGSFEACYLEVAPGKTLTIGAGDYVRVNGDMTVDGSLIIQHEGSFLQTESDAKVTNNGIINVELTTPFLKPRDFMIMGSPMSSETRDGVFEDAFLVLDHTTANFFPNAEVAAAFPGAENFADDNTINGKFWNQYPSGNISTAKGYLVRPQSGYGDGNKTYDMTYKQGTLNNGDISYSVQFNNNKNDSPNVLANPYPSAIWANDFINANSMVSEVYFWEHITPPSTTLPGSGSMNFSMQDISMYNLLGGNPAASDPGTSTTPNGYISTGQGFGIKATAAGTATFTNAMREVANNNTLRTPVVQSEVDRIWLNISNKELEVQNTTLIGFTPQATDGLDDGYDSRRLATILSIYSHLGDGSQEFGIQSLGAFVSGTKVPVGFSSQIAEEIEYTISIANLDGDQMTNATVYLYDSYMGTLTNLTEVDYVFSSNKGTFDQRFTLQFEEDSILGVHENQVDIVSIYPNPAADVLNISTMAQEQISTIEIYDISGRRVLNQAVEGQTSYQLDVSSLKASVYFININLNGKSITKKIIKR